MIKYVLIFFAVVAVAFVFWIIRTFMRLGNPVNAQLSDSYYYHRWKKKIIYSPMGNWFELGYYETEADVATFSVIERDYGKDHQFVFLRGRKQQVDLATFQVDKNRIPKDHVHVYFEKPYSDSLLRVEGADPKTYQPYVLPADTYNQGWCRDDQAYYLHGVKVEVDRKTFQRLNSSLAIDSLNVYIIKTDSDLVPGKQLIKKASNPGGEVHAITETYAQVGHTLILANWKTDFRMLAFPKIDSIHVLTERILVVNNQLVADGRVIEGFDPSTFQELSRNHFKDKDRVYYEGIQITGADPDTFEVLREEYAKDHRAAYYQERVLPEVNPASFRTDYENNTLIATDGILKFKEGVLVKN
jgi:hypothetical protein